MKCPKCGGSIYNSQVDSCTCCAWSQTGPLPVSVPLSSEWLNDAVWCLGLDREITLVTPYRSHGEMIEHIVAKAHELAAARKPHRAGKEVGGG